MIMKQKALDAHLLATGACVHNELQGLKSIDKLTVLSSVTSTIIYNSARTRAWERVMILALADDLLTMLADINEAGHPRQPDETTALQAEELEALELMGVRLSDVDLSKSYKDILPPHLEKSSEDLAVAIRIFVMATVSAPDPEGDEK